MEKKVEGTGRSAKMRRTRIAITEHARKLTATHGLSGFTVEDVCGPVGISRRTFFNYFPSKEAAVVGTLPDFLDSEPMQDFLQAGTADGKISPQLLDDLVEVMIRFTDEVLDIAGTLTDVNAIMAREPAFMDRFIADHETLLEQLTRLICEREGLAQDDPRPALGVHLVGSLMHTTLRTFFTQGSSGSVGPQLREALTLTRTLFTQ